MKQRAATTAFRLFGLAGKQRLNVLIYHRVLDAFDPMRPSEPNGVVFDWHMRVLRQYFEPLGLDEALSLMDAGQLPDRAVCVTFDDGYADNQRIALPILKKWNIPATVFVASSFLDGGRMWNDTVIEVFRRCPAGEFDTGVPGIGVVNVDTVETRLRAAMTVIAVIKYKSTSERTAFTSSMAERVQGLPEDLMLTTSGLRKLVKAGIDIGGHTRSHPILTSLNTASAFAEIANGKSDLEEKIDAPVHYFAYPNGRRGEDYTEEHVEMVKDIGFKGAFSTHPGVTSLGSDPWQRPRFTPWDANSFRFIARILLNFRKCV
jgi:peptidoglycan/xylan/chitin deacetylase (PgdA/CDA1 family)